MRTRRRPLAQINIVPYIDVMLVLLIIFMITAPLLTQGVDVKLPEAPAKALSAKAKTPIILSIDRRGNYYLNISKSPHKPLNKNTIIQIARTKLSKTKHPVYVKGDQGVKYGKVVQAMVWLQQAGADKVGLITQPPAKN